MIKYRTVCWKPGTIEEIEVVRETPKMVEVITGRFRGMEAKQCDSHQYHDTWEDAKAHLVDVAETKLCRAMRGVDRRKEELQLAKSLRKPGSNDD